MTKVNQLSETRLVQQQEVFSNPQSKLSVQINMNDAPKASKKVSNDDIEKALNETSARKAVNQLLAKSPVGLGLQSQPNELGVLGYADTGMRQFHMGAPICYQSSDGGTITVYNDMRMGQTDVGPRTTIYETGRYKQTIIYNDLGEPTKGTITIKDDVAGFVEAKYDFEIKDGKVTNLY